MALHIHPGLRTTVLVIFVLVLSGCSLFYREPVRHLVSDAALIVPGQATKSDVLAYLGEPDERRAVENGEEVWIYTDTKKSTLRKTPYIGPKLGTENYDMVNVSFSGETVSSCVYRRFNEEEIGTENDGPAEGEKKE